MSQYLVKPFGVGAMVEVQDAEHARSVAVAVREALAPHSCPVVPGATTVVVGGTDHLYGRPLFQMIEAAVAHAAPPAAAPSARVVDVPVRYDGADLETVASGLGISIAEVITRHVAGEYRVEFLGFAPGFPYLSGLDPLLSTVGRREVPRTRVPAGSVGLAAGRTCIYPTVSPGGWNLLGRTEMVLFDAMNEESPAALAPGDRVRLVATR